MKAIWSRSRSRKRVRNARRGALLGLKPRRLLTEPLEDRLLLTVVTWDGGDGNNLLWSNADNWSDNRCPGIGDDVTIAASGNVTILHDGDPTEIGSLNVQNNLEVRSSTLKVTGDLTVSSGKWLRAVEADADITALGNTTVNGVSLYAEAGGTIALAGITQVTNTVGDMIWQVSGAESVLSLPNLEKITNSGTGSNWDIYLRCVGWRPVGLVQRDRDGRPEFRQSDREVDPGEGRRPGQRGEAQRPAKRFRLHRL